MYVCSRHTDKTLANKRIYTHDVQTKIDYNLKNVLQQTVICMCECRSICANLLTDSSIFRARVQIKEARERA